MAAIENLEIIVDVDISEAVANLSQLQEELDHLADKIADVDRRGSRGIDIATRVDSIDDDLTILSSKIESWEAANGIDIDTNMGGLSGAAAMSAMRGGGGGGGGIGGVSGFLDAFSMGDEGGIRGAVSGLREGLSTLSEESQITNINMSDMHNLLARIVPLLVVFIGAIPAAITAIYTLAAAAAAAAASMMAIVGFGAMGFAMQGGSFNAQRLTEAFNRVQQDFIDAFAPLANRLQPIFEDALSGLGRFFEAVASEGDALMALTDEARAFGGFLMEFVPSALRTLAALVESMSGIFGNMGRWLNQNFASVVRTLVKLTAEIVPTLAEFASVIGKALPAIVRLSIGFMQVAGAAIRFLGVLGRMLGWLGISERVLGVVIGSLLSLITLFALGASIIGSVFVTSLIGAVKGLKSLALAINASNVSLLRMAKLAAIIAVSAIYKFILGIVSAIPALGSLTVAGYSAASALAAVLTLLTIGAGLALVGMAMSAAAGFLSMADGIDSAASSLKDFKRIQSGMGGSEFGGEGDDPYGFNPDNPDNNPSGGGAGGVTVFNVESSGNPSEDRSNMEYADWMSGRTTGK